MWMHWLDDNYLEWESDRWKPLLKDRTPFVATEEEFDAFISGDPEKLWYSLMHNPDFNEWFTAAKYDPEDPPRAVDIDDVLQWVVENDGYDGWDAEEALTGFRGLQNCFPNLFPPGTVFGDGNEAKTAFGVGNQKRRTDPQVQEEHAKQKRTRRAVRQGRRRPGPTKTEKPRPKMLPRKLLSLLALLSETPPLALVR